MRTQIGVQSLHRECSNFIFSSNPFNQLLFLLLSNQLYRLTYTTLLVLLSLFTQFFRCRRRSASYRLGPNRCRNALGTCTTSAASAFTVCHRLQRTRRNHSHRNQQQQQPTELSNSFEFRSRNAIRSLDRVVRLRNLSGGGGGTGVVTEMPCDVT
jgi:hypothetical protein